MTVEKRESRLAFLSPFFFPEPISTGRYNSDLACALNDKGLSVLAITSEPLYPDWKPQSTELKLPGIEVVRGGRRMRYPSAAVLRRLTLELWYLCFLAYELPRRKPSVNAVVAVFPPVLFLPLAKAVLRKGIPVIGIVHDLQSVFVERSSSPARKVLRSVVKEMEGRALKACDLLIFLSRSMADRAIALHGLDATKCRVHLPFVSLDTKSESAGQLAELFPGNRRHVVYSGALGEKQNPEALVACLTEISRGSADIVCHIFSRGPVFDALAQRHSGVGGLKFHDLVPEENLMELLEKSDVQVVPQAFGTSEAALPSKLPNLIAAGVPVLAICDDASEVGQIVKEAEAGAVVHSWDPATVAAAAVNLLATTKDQSREQRRVRAMPFVERNFSLDRLVKDIAGFVRG